MQGDFFEGELTSKKYISFIWPSVLMMLVLSLYYTIDSIFVANLVGEEGLAAINIAYPVQGLMWGFAVMLAAGSSALVAIIMGEGDAEKANSRFSFTCAFAVGLGTLITLLLLACMTQLVNLLGATETLTEDCHIFLNIFVWGAPAAFLGVLMEYFIRVDGDPAFTILLYISGGVVHLGLDILLMGPLHMGLAGAAIANVCGLAITAFIGILYFLFKDTRLRFSRFTVNWQFIGHSFANGSPEFVNESAMGIMIFFYNLVVIRLAGEIGVAAVAVVLNLHYFFMSVHMGYQAGSMPLISYYYGAKAYEKINLVMRMTKTYIIISSVGIAAAFALAAPLLARVYASPGTELYEMSVVGLRIVSVSLLTIGVNVFASGFFTCFGNGLISSLIAVSRGFIMLLIGLFALTHFFGMTGAWMALPFADVTTLALSFGLMAKYRNRYHYRILG